jgi:NDP-mannose synthase
MQAVILAGGKGTRLKPYTVVFPKPLMPIGDYPILEVIVRQLKKRGFKQIVLTLGHQQDMFRLFFGDGHKWGLDIRYSLEEKPLGTAGPLKLVEGLDDTFLMMNGDILTDLDFAELMAFHRAHGHPATIVTHRREVKIDYGTLHYDGQGFLEKYVEKPTLGYNVSMGIYVLSRSVIDLIPDGVPFDFPQLMTALIDNNCKVVCRPYNGYWLDIGRPDDYELAIDSFEKMKDQLL